MSRYSSTIERVSVKVAMCSIERNARDPRFVVDFRARSSSKAMFRYCSRPVFRTLPVSPIRARFISRSFMSYEGQIWWEKKECERGTVRRKLLGETVESARRESDASIEPEFGYNETENDRETRTIEGIWPVSGCKST